MRLGLLTLVSLFTVSVFAQTRGARNDEDRLAALFYGQVAPFYKSLYSGNLSELRQQEFSAAETQLGPLFAYLLLADSDSGRASLLTELYKQDPALKRNKERAGQFFSEHPELIFEIFKNPHASILIMIEDLEKIQPVRKEYSKEIAGKIKATLHPEIADAVKKYLSPVVVGLHTNAQTAVQLNDGLVSGVYTKFLYRIFTLYQSFRIHGIYSFLERFMFDYTGKELPKVLAALEARKQTYSSQQCLNLF